MASFPENWDFTVKGLATVAGRAGKSISAALKNLEDAGYLLRSRDTVKPDSLRPISSFYTMRKKSHRCRVFRHRKTVNGKTVAGKPDANK